MRLKMEFGYNGRKYNGYQIQKDKLTIQGAIENAMSMFFETPITIVASGRTDAGVSAIRQVAHFDIDEDILLTQIPKINDKELNSLAIRINYILDNDIKIHQISLCNSEFHARHSAKLKTYCYNFYISNTEIPYLSQFCLWLKDSRMHVDIISNALKRFEGEHDFTSFCSSNTDVDNKIRTITSTNFSCSDLGYYTISITGNGFLYNMVRIIVGTVLDVARGKIDIEDIDKIINAKDRAMAGKTVSAEGLVLKEVKY